jgi:hypothetical protein
VEKNESKDDAGRLSMLLQNGVSDDHDPPESTSKETLSRLWNQPGETWARVEMKLAVETAKTVRGAAGKPA